VLTGDTVVDMMMEGRRVLQRQGEARAGWTLRYPSWRQGFKEELTMHREEMS
jgi:hypothetical protein